MRARSYPSPARDPHARAPDPYSSPARDHDRGLRNPPHRVWERQGEGLQFEVVPAQWRAHFSEARRIPEPVTSTSLPCRFYVGSMSV